MALCLYDVSLLFKLDYRYQSFFLTYIFPLLLFLQRVFTQKRSVYYPLPLRRKEKEEAKVNQQMKTSPKLILSQSASTCISSDTSLIPTRRWFSPDLCCLERTSGWDCAAAREGERQVRCLLQVTQRHASVSEAHKLSLPLLLSGDGDVKHSVKYDGCGIMAYETVIASFAFT